MRISDELRIALTRATTEAKTRKHEYLTLEHLLLALLHDPSSAEMLSAVGVNLSSFRKRIRLVFRPRHGASTEPRWVTITRTHQCCNQSLSTCNPPCRSNKE